MRKNYDFSKAKVRKGPVLNPKTTKVQTSIRIDGDVMMWAQKEADRLGVGYQTFLNMKLRESMEKPDLEARVEAIERKLKRV